MAFSAKHVLLTLTVVILVPVLAGGLALAAGWWFLTQAAAPLPGPKVEVVFLVRPGETGAAIGRQLEADGLIRDERWFRLLLRLQPDQGAVRAGEYRLHSHMGLFEILGRLRRGEVLLHRVTVPEGTDLFQLRTILDGCSFLVEHESYQQLVTTPALARELGLDLPTAEGVLFPETYFCTRDTPVAEVLRRMTATFRQEWTTLLAEHALPEGLTPEQAVILASIVEKEAGLTAERPLVAGVFLNRLRRKMLLQADPTVIYALKEAGSWDGNIRKADLERDHPYNTYVRPGLPPGPICNPGRASLRAVLVPEETDYLYFVSRNDGSHVFAKTYREHQRNVQRFQR
jgi:UPF0755 protein